MVRSRNLAKKYEQKNRDRGLRWFNVWPTSIHQSLLFVISMLDSFDVYYTQYSIYR